MVFRVELAPAAVEDLDRIAVYIRERGSFESADRWFRGIIGEIRSLREMPRRCPISEESGALGAVFGEAKSPVQDLFFGA